MEAKITDHISQITIEKLREIKELPICGVSEMTQTIYKIGKIANYLIDLHHREGIYYERVDHPEKSNLISDLLEQRKELDALIERARMEDETVEGAVIQQIRERAKRGLEKYGTSMERNDLDTGDWLLHLQEELLDAAVYVQKLRNIYPLEGC